MWTLIFIILLIVVFAKLITLAIKATWSIAKVIFTIILPPVLLIALVIAGFTYIAIPILVVIGIIALIRSAA